MDKGVRIHYEKSCPVTRVSMAEKCATQANSCDPFERHILVTGGAGFIAFVIQSTFLPQASQ